MSGTPPTAQPSQRMNATKISLKLYARGALPDAGLFVATFHDLIRRREPREQMIDVVDYGHVHEGPSVLFVGHESDYAVDHGEGRAGLLYQRKRAPAPGDGSFAAHLDDALRRAIAFGARLEREPALAGLQLGADEIFFRLHDRLQAPNTPATFATIEGDLHAAAARLWGAGATVTYEPGDGRGLLAVRLRASDAAGPLADLAARMG
jgi:hypothetical protein